MGEIETEIQAEAPVQETVVENNQPEKVDPPVKSDKPESIRDTILRSKAEIEGRARDESGKFVKEPKAKAPKESKENKELKAAPEKVEAPVTESPPVAEVPQAQDAPKAWGKEKQALWNSLSQEAKDFLLKREEQVSSGFKQYENLGPVKQFIERHSPTFTQMGVAPSQFMENALSYHMAFMNPQTRDAAARDFLATYGIQIPSTAPQSSDPNDPVQHVAPLVQQYVNPLQQEVSALKATLSQQEQERINSHLQSFAKDHPHFEKVRVTMGRLIQSGEVQPNDLESAYQKAVWADPDIRNDLMKAEFDKQTKAQQEAAEKARKANVSVTTRAPTAPLSNGHAKTGSETARDTVLRSIKEVRENMRA